MSRAVQEGCIASCVRCSLLPDRTHKSCLLHSTAISVCSLLHVNPVRCRIRHLHVVHGLSNPLAKLSSMLTVALCGIACSLLSHALHRITLGRKSAGFTLRKKQFLDSILLSAGSDHIESEPHWFPVWSFPLEHIHISGCLVAQFQPASTGLLHWLVSGIL